MFHNYLWLSNCLWRRLWDAKNVSGNQSQFCLLFSRQSPPHVTSMGCVFNVDLITFSCFCIYRRVFDGSGRVWDAEDMGKNFSPKSQEDGQEKKNTEKVVLGCGSNDSFNGNWILDHGYSLISKIFFLPFDIRYIPDISFVRLQN